MRYKKSQLSAVALVLLTLSKGLLSCDFPKERLRRHHLSLISEGIPVQAILYSEEDAWGWGPGANETGIIVYELSSSVADEIEDKGLDYFSALPMPDSEDRRSLIDASRPWHTTPIAKNEEAWFKVPASDEVTSAPKLENYINQWGHGIPVEPEIEEMVNTAVSMPSSFYSDRAGGGTIVVAPDIRRIFYIYAG